MKRLYVLLFLLAGCGLRIPSTHPSPDPTPVLPVSAQDADDCQRAEDRIRALDCHRADGTARWLTPKGAPFAEYCRTAISDGRSPRPDCIALVTSCATVDEAYSTPEGIPCQAAN